MVAAAVGVSAAAGLAGSAMSSSAAGKAANAQSAAADEANAVAREQYEKNTANLQPYMNAGTSALGALMYRMGLGTGTGGRELTEQEIRNELRGQYTTAGQSGNPPPLDSLLTNGRDRSYSSAQWGFDPATNKWGYQVSYNNTDDAGNNYNKWVYADPKGATSDSVDEAALNAAVQQRLAQQAAAKNDPAYGSLLSQFKEYKPFSMADFQEDPGYQFRLQQGNNALQNMAAMTGNLNSGRALKDAIAYNSGMGAQEYQNAYGRYNNDYLTGFNTHNTNQTNAYNKLMGITGIGQSSASALANVGQNYSGQVGNNLAQGANAQASGIVGQSNAINQGIGSVSNALGNYFTTNRDSGYDPYGRGPVR